MLILKPVIIIAPLLQQVMHRFSLKYALLASIGLLFACVYLYNQWLVFETLFWKVLPCLWTFLEFYSSPDRIDAQYSRRRLCALVTLFLAIVMFIPVVTSSMGLSGIFYIGILYQVINGFLISYEFVKKEFFNCKNQAISLDFYLRVLKEGSLESIERIKNELSLKESQPFVDLNELEQRLALLVIEKQLLALWLPCFYHFEKNGEVYSLKRQEVKLTTLQYLVLMKRVDVIREYQLEPITVELLVMALRLRDVALVECIRYRLLGPKPLLMYTDYMLKRNRLLTNPLAVLEKVGIALPQSTPTLDKALYKLKGVTFDISHNEVVQMVNDKQIMALEQLKQKL